MKKYVYLLIAIMPLTSIAQEKISFFNQNGKIEFQISKEEFFIKISTCNLLVCSWLKCSQGFTFGVKP
mgnify:CR=1 FL=1